MDRCQQCDALWHECARATMRHGGLLMEQQNIAAQSFIRFLEFQPVIWVAEHARHKAHAALQDHLAKDHAAQTRTMDSGQGG